MPRFYTFDTLFAIFRSSIYGGEEKDGRTAEMVREAAISHWLAVFGAPEIIASDKDMRFIGKVFQEFRTSLKIALQTVIPGHHQSLGATERRIGHLGMIIDHIIGGSKANWSTQKERK